MKIIIGEKKNKYTWETDITSKDTMPIKVLELDKEDVAGIWHKDLRLFAVQTADEVSRDITDHIVMDKKQAEMVATELSILAGFDNRQENLILAISLLNKAIEAEKQEDIKYLMEQFRGQAKYLLSLKKKAIENNPKPKGE